MLLMAKKKPRTGWPDRLRKLRAKYDLTQREAAARARVSYRAWVAWEGETRTPGQLALQLLRDAFPNDKI